MITAIDPVRLVGLKQAAYVMQCLIKGQNKEEIVIALGGDDQLVSMWISFLLHNRWITEGGEGWSVTAKGTNWNMRNGSTHTTS
jgi:hypothetical protein